MPGPATAGPFQRPLPGRPVFLQPPQSGVDLFSRRPPARPRSANPGGGWQTPPGRLPKGGSAGGPGLGGRSPDGREAAPPLSGKGGGRQQVYPADSRQRRRRAGGNRSTPAAKSVRGGAVDTAPARTGWHRAGQRSRPSRSPALSATGGPPPAPTGNRSTSSPGDGGKRVPLYTAHARGEGKPAAAAAAAAARGWPRGQAPAPRIGPGDPRGGKSRPRGPAGPLSLSGKRARFSPQRAAGGNAALGSLPGPRTPRIGPGTRAEEGTKADPRERGRPPRALRYRGPLSAPARRERPRRKEGRKEEDSGRAAAPARRRARAPAGRFGSVRFDSLEASDKSLCRGLILNRSQRGSCSATYETLTQNQVVYE
ncbi:collagen alpha-1(I) chain-like [Oenanthe melanoleuca]|uniref:collagen alpha-1(I) chain-like n=1 Tax=Oenanthe melanoleuca TaxID=2939378 RepID=UPI0024C1F7CA|nr:collagen alpha-1(I) chain-like [Oenanthe melanoleuca]